MKKIGMRIKLGFGIGDLGGNLFFTLIGFYCSTILPDVVKLPASLAGTALMIGKIWDAVTDPATGFMSDPHRLEMGAPPSLYLCRCPGLLCRDDPDVLASGETWGRWNSSC